jgi:hypothetical protein
LFWGMESATCPTPNNQHPTTNTQRPISNTQHPTPRHRAPRISSPHFRRDRALGARCMALCGTREQGVESRQRSRLTRQ